jgi:hypothetical protein
MPASTVTSATSTKRHSIATMPHPGTIENLNVGKTIARRRTTISTDSKSIFVRFIQRKERRCGKAERHALPNYIREHRIDFKCTDGMVNVPKDPEEPKDERVIQRKPLAAKRGPVMLSLWTDIDIVTGIRGVEAKIRLDEEIRDGDAITYIWKSQGGAY